MRKHITTTLIFISLLLTHVSNCIAQCQTPTLLGINRQTPYGIYHVLYTYSQPGTYYLEYGPVGFTPGTGATPGVGGTMKVLNSTFGVAGISIAGSGTIHCYLRLFCNNTIWTANSPVMSYTLGGANSPVILPLNGLNNTTYIPFNNPGSPSLLNTCWGDGIGDEYRVRFDCPDSAYYQVTVSGNSLIANFSYKELNSTTTLASYSCQTNYTTSSNFPYYTLTYTLGPLIKGKVYDLLFDALDTIPYAIDVKVLCPMPEVISINNIEPTSVRLNWSCSCSDSLIVEYGPTNFVPGTGNAPGVNGTILLATSSPFTINGLTPFTTYDIYMRSACGGNYSPNKKMKTKTAKDCNSFPVINCNGNAVFNYTGSLAVRGAWDGLGCVATSDSSEERVYKFTPTISGWHILNVTNFTASSTGYVYTAHYSYKTVSAGCNEFGWTCIGTSFQNPLTFTPQAIPFGPLVAGTTYYIAADGQSFPSYRTYTYTFNVECAMNCTPPPTPGVITATGGNTKVCANETKTYSIVPVPGATTYVWTAPAGSSITSGQNTTSVNVLFNNLFPPSDTLRVVAVSACGLSAQQKLKISKNVPATPGTITVTGGIANVCPGESRTYTIAPVTGATSYTWTKPNGSNMTGQGTTSIVLTFTSVFTGNDTLRVTAFGGCGSSAQRKLAIKKNLPATPGTIVVSGGNVKVCPGETRTYTIPAAAGATSYVWTPPTGATIVSGQGTVSVNLLFNSGFTVNDTLRVVSSNGCGISGQRKLTIARNNPATPAAIAGQNYGLCNLNAIPFSVTNVAGLTYNWSFNLPGATVATGQGTNAITANFGAGFLNATLSVTGSNGCGVSLARTYNVYAKPATPIAITGVASVCANQQDVPYSIAPLTNITNYTWTGPTGSHISDGIINSVSNSLVTTSTAVTVDFATTAGNINVRGNNSCASGSNRTLAVAIVCREEFPETGIEENFDISILPNPNNGDFTLQFMGTINNIVQGTIFDLVGNAVAHVELKNNSDNSFNLKLAPGIYYIKFEDVNRSVVKKMVVQ